MKRKTRKYLFLIAITTACCAGLTSCAGMFGSVGVGPNGQLDGDIGISTGPSSPGPGAPGAPGAPVGGPGGGAPVGPPPGP